MPLRISNLRMGIDEDEQALPAQLARALAIPAADIVRWRILRKSLDLRDKGDLAYVYSAEVLVGDEKKLREASLQRHPEWRIEEYREPAFEMPLPGPTPLAHRPVVVGAGPAGLAAAYFLAEQGYRPLVLERGKPVHDRIRDVHAFEAGGTHDPESNYLFGEGGAGAFSDGKLTCRLSGPDVRRILQLFADCKGKPSILYDYRPHLGSNRLPAVVKALRRGIEALGGEFRFQCRLEDLDLVDGRLRGLTTSSGGLAADCLILAIGHSARDTYEMLFRRGVAMLPKPFQIGVRIEQPQEHVNRFQYGPARLEERLGAADYRVIARLTPSGGGSRELFSFCMCAGGQVIPSISEAEHFCTNGMSLSSRNSPFANSGLMITLDPGRFGSSHPLAGMMRQREFEGRAFDAGRREYRAPIQWAADFLAGRRSHGKIPSSYRRGVEPGEIAALVPRVAEQALRLGLPVLDRRWHGEFLRDATLTGPESRGSAPVRILRDAATRECLGVAGLYPIGEGAGYAGGIVSAAVDGLRTAREIIRRHAPAK